MSNQFWQQSYNKQQSIRKEVQAVHGSRVATGSHVFLLAEEAVAPCGDDSGSAQDFGCPNLVTNW